MHPNRYICTNLEIIQPMAKLNYSESGPLTSGKIGGQQIIKNRHGVILQSISQPPSFGTAEQKKQRFVTNTLAQKWKQLTALQKQSFADSATTWFKKSKSGQLINQSPYGLFLFLQQNSALIGEDGPLFGVDYQSLIEPQAYLVSKSQTSIIVKSDNTVNDYEYLVFIDPRTTDFRVSQLNSELLVGRLTALELGNGVDVATMIQSHYDFPVNMSKISTRISAVEMGTGRRSEEIRWLYQLPATELITSVGLPNANSGMAMSQNGTTLLFKQHNNGIVSYDLSTPWDASVFISKPIYYGLLNPTQNFVFSEDGLHMYVCTGSGNPSEVRYYRLSIPYDVTTQVFMSSLSVVSNQGSRTLYISKDGTILIVSNLSATYRFVLSTAFDLSTATLNSSNTNLKSLNNTSIWYSTDGMTLFVYDAVLLKQYNRLSSFSIESLTGSPVKELNVSAISGFTGDNFSALFMPYNGLHFAISVYRSGSAAKDFATFKFGSPFNL